MDRNTVTNLIPDAPRPLSLEEAIAMAPPEASSPFTASTAAIAWGAVRSGQSVWEFLIGLTREFEEKLQVGYEVWKAENAAGDRRICLSMVSVTAGTPNVPFATGLKPSQLNSDFMYRFTSLSPPRNGYATHLRCPRTTTLASDGASHQGGAR